MLQHKKPGKTLGRDGLSSESPMWRGKGFIILEYLQKLFSKIHCKDTESEISKSKHFRDNYSMFKEKREILFVIYYEWFLMNNVSFISVLAIMTSFYRRDLEKSEPTILINGEAETRLQFLWPCSISLGGKLSLENEEDTA